MGFGQRRDLHGFGQAADVANINAGELGDATLKIGQKRPFAGEFLADGKGNIDHRAQRLRRLRAFRRGSVLREIERTGGHPLAEGSGFGDAEAMMIIDAENRA